MSRDGARTPMPWFDSARDHAGFSTTTPWLPIGSDHFAMAVDRQNADSGSLLNLTRHLLAVRHASEALMTGTVKMVDVTDTLLAFERSSGDETLLCVFNLSADPIEWRPTEPDRWRVLDAVGAAENWRFGGYAALIAQRL